MCDQKRANHVLGLDDNVFPEDDRDDDEEDDFDFYDVIDFSDYDGDGSETNTNTFTSYDGSSTASSFTSTARGASVIPEQHTFQKTTPLFDAIDNKYWSSVENFLTTGRWTKTKTSPAISFFSGATAAAAAKDSASTSAPKIPLQEEARTWSVTLDKSGKVLARRLPLHAALMNKAPRKIVKTLVDLYPEATECLDCKGNLPLHLAYEYGAENPIITYLLQIYPEADEEKNIEGLLPSECAEGTPRSTQMIQVDGTKTKAGSKTISTTSLLSSKTSSKDMNTSSGGKLAQIASQFARGSKAKPRQDTTETHLDDLKQELASIRQQKSSSGSTNVTANNNTTSNQESFEGWMKSINDFQDSIFGTSTENSEASKHTKRQHTTSLLPPIREFDSGDDSDSQIASSNDHHRSHSSPGRWRQSLRKLASKEVETGQELAGHADEEEESVEVNLASTRSISSTGKMKKRFPFANPFRKSKAGQNRQQELMETVTITSNNSRDTAGKRPNSLSLFSLGTIEKEMEGLSVSNSSPKRNSRGRQLHKKKRTRKRSKSPIGRLFGKTKTADGESKTTTRALRSQSKSPRRQSRAIQDNASSYESSNNSSTPKKSNSGKSQGGFFRKRPHGWLLKNTNGPKNGIQNSSVFLEDAEIQKKFKNAKGESVASGSYDEGVTHSLFSWDFMNNDATKTPAKEVNESDHVNTGTPSSSSSSSRARTTSPFNPSFLENSLLISSATAPKRSLHDENRIQRGGSFGKHFILGALEDEEDDIDSPMDTFESRTSGDDCEEDFSGTDSTEDDDRAERDGVDGDCDDDSVGSHSQDSFSSNEGSVEGDLSEDEDNINNATANTNNQDQASHHTDPSWFFHDNQAALMTVFSDQPSEVLSAQPIEEANASASRIIAGQDQMKVLSSIESGNGDKQKQSHRRMRSLGSMVGKNKHRRKASFGSIGNKSEGHRRKASLGSFRGFLRGKKLRHKHASDSVSTHAASECQITTEQTSESLPSANTIPEKPDSTFLTMQLQQKAVEAMKRAQTAKSASVRYEESRNPSESSRPAPVNSVVERASSSKLVVSKKADWRSEYRAYLSGTGTGKTGARSIEQLPTLSAGSILRQKSSATPDAEEILEDLEQFPPSPFATSQHRDRSSSRSRVKSASAQSSGPVVSESTVENSDSGNVYLVRVQF